MKDLVDTQTRNVERAFTMDSGPFIVAPGYADKREIPKKWVKQSKVYKERAISPIHKISMCPPIDNPTSSSTAAVCDSENIPPLYFLERCRAL